MSNTLRVKVRERWYTVEVEDLGLDPVKTLVDGAPVEVHIEATGADSLPAAPVESPPEETSQDEIVAPAPARATATRAMASPMPGVIVSVAVQVGDQLVTGRRGLCSRGHEDAASPASRLDRHRRRRPRWARSTGGRRRPDHRVGVGPVRSLARACA